jgi:hypothetical protein
MNKEKTTLTVYKDDLKRFNILKLQNDFNNQEDYFHEIMNTEEKKQKEQKSENPFPI